MPVLDQKLSAQRASKVAREIADHMGESVAPRQIQAMVKVARSHDPDVVRFVDRFLTSPPPAPRTG